MKSTQFSMDGYSFKTWAVRNLETFKLLGSAMAGLLAFYLPLLPAPWNVSLGILATVVGKLLLDAIHFWASEVTLEK